MWWKRLLAGAAAVVVLASAVSGVVALWPDPPPVQAARFTSTPTLRLPIPLVEYQQTVLNRAQSPGETSQSGRSGPGPVAIGQAAGLSAASKDLLTTSPPAVPAVESLEKAAPAAIDGLSSPTPSSTTSSSSTSSSPTSSTSTPTSTTSTPTSTGTGRIGVPAERLFSMTSTQREIIEEKIVPLAQKQARSLGIPSAEKKSEDGSDTPVRTLANLASISELGEEISAEAAAARVVRLFNDIRPAKASAGKQGPSGVVIDVNIELEGLRGTPVFLRWSILDKDGEQQLLGNWLSSVIAERYIATSERATVAAEVWVPLPARPGSYVVKLEVIKNDPGEAPLAAILTEPFN